MGHSDSFNFKVVLMVMPYSNESRLRLQSIEVGK